MVLNRDGQAMQSDIYTDKGVISWVLDHCKVLHLGLTDDQGTTYVVPVNFGYHEDEKGHYTLYIHGTNNGQKAHALDHETVIGFETDGGHEELTYTPPTPSAFGPSYRSVIGKGQVLKIHDNQEKLVALQTIIHHYQRDNPAVIHASDLDHVAVWKIEVQDISAKIHHPTVEWQRVLGIKEHLTNGYLYDSEGKILVKSVKNVQPDSAVDTGASASVKDNK